MLPSIDAHWIENLIETFVTVSPENSLQNESAEKAFDRPLVGFARGDDPLFEAYKEHVGPFHLTPWEIYALTFGQLDVSPAELTVISYILPQTEATKADNRREKHHPSDRWARARIYGEEVNNKLRRHIVEALQKEGCRAVAPSLTAQFSRRLSPRYGFASTWSERHAAHAAGLGTFGLCDGLITPLGKAMRTGSVVARLQIAPTPRPYSDHRAYCLYYSRGICKKCAKRCPAGAISEQGKDKILCYHYVRKMREYVKAHYGFDGYGCGLCQTGVPCESKIPLKAEG